jgi:hypothetical protein
VVSSSSNAKTRKSAREVIVSTRWADENSTDEGARRRTLPAGDPPVSETPTCPYHGPMTRVVGPREELVEIAAIPSNRRAVRSAGVTEWWECEKCSALPETAPMTDSPALLQALAITDETGGEWASRVGALLRAHVATERAALSAEEG